jgi:hypothetical protein
MQRKFDIAVVTLSYDNVLLETGYQCGFCRFHHLVRYVLLSGSDLRDEVVCDEDEAIAIVQGAQQNRVSTGRVGNGAQVGP